MNHRKVHSLGNVPFSWEDSPGVSKVASRECSEDLTLTALILTRQPSSFSCQTDSHEKTIPPPPYKFQAPRRSASLKGLWLEEDPFLAAFKECTKDSFRYDKMQGETKKDVVSKVRKSKWSIFSCKDSCDIEDVNSMRLLNLPPLPKERHRGLSKMRK